MSLNDGGLLKYIDSFTGYNHFVFYYLFAFIVIVTSYLLGSINSAVIISKTVYHDDVRKHGSGNPGLTNMLRTYGLGAAGMTLAGDLLKTVIAIFISAILFGFNYVGGISTGEGLCYVAALFTVIGHIAPVYYKFKGGKGVLTTAVSIAILSPIPFAILLTLFIIVVYFSKYVSLGSIIGAILYPVLLHGYFSIAFSASDKSLPGLAALSSITIAILVVYCHRGNIQRISDRTERKISFKKKVAADEEEKNESEEPKE